jgi:hypothetical protein
MDFMNKRFAVNKVTGAALGMAPDGGQVQKWQNLR